MSGQGTRRHLERGAAAVEGALLLSLILAPLLLGVLYYGQYLWKLQAVPALDPNLDQSAFVGTYCTGQLPQLLDRVKAAVVSNAGNVDGATNLPLSLSNVTTAASGYTPNGLGLDVLVSIRVPVVSNALSVVALPNDGNVVQDSLIRLQNVSISTGSC